MFLIYQPHLEYLNIHIDGATIVYDYSIKPFPPLLNVHELHFHSHDMATQFDTLAELLTYFPNLKRFSLNLRTECHLFFDGDILQTLVHSLDSFQFSIARLSEPTHDERTLSTFYTPFWLETKQWYTQCYWHSNEDIFDWGYFHIYSVPYSFSDFDIYKCTNESLLTSEILEPFSKVQQLDLTETSDVSIIPFLKCCPNVRTICLNNIYDDEENYGTDEEEDITDQNDDSKCIIFLQIVFRQTIQPCKCHQQEF